MVDYEGYLPLAPGMALVKAGGHTPGSQMVYVALQSGREYLLIGDATWHMDGVRLMKGKDAPWVTEDQNAVLDQLRWLNQLSRTDPRLVIVASHDEEQHAELVKSGRAVEPTRIGAGSACAIKKEDTHDLLRCQGPGRQLPAGSLQHDSDCRGDSGRQIRFHSCHARHAQHRADARPHRRGAAVPAARASQSESADLQTVNFMELIGPLAAAKRRKSRTKAEDRGAAESGMATLFASFLEGLTDDFLAETVIEPPGMEPSDQDALRDAAVGEGARDASPRAADAAAANDRPHAAPHAADAGADGAARRCGSGGAPAR